MKNRNMVYIACSLDGYIADKNGGLDWLHSITNPDQEDMGFAAFNSQIDALIMGRTTFETVCAFDCDWPYTRPVFVLSNTLTSIPEEYADKAQLVKGSLSDILNKLNSQGYHRLYIDGGATIQSFLKEDLINDLIITTFPILLGGGAPLFSDLPEPLAFEHVKTEVFLDALVQSHYKRKR